jgi:hypothetical protein
MKNIKNEVEGEDKVSEEKDQMKLKKIQYKVYESLMIKCGFLLFVYNVFQVLYYFKEAVSESGLSGTSATAFGPTAIN